MPLCPLADGVELPWTEAFTRGHGVLVVPSFVERNECDLFMMSASDHIRQSSWKPHQKYARMRLPVASKLAAAHETCDAVIRRALAFVETNSELSTRLFGQAQALSEMGVTFAVGEPAVNVYRSGGEFPQHEDGHMLTILVPLSPVGDFVDGGTAFWPTEASSEPFDEAAHDRELLFVRDLTGPGLLLRPAAGTLILFVGSITHAGLPITDGSAEASLWLNQTLRIPHLSFSHSFCVLRRSGRLWEPPGHLWSPLETTVPTRFHKDLVA